MTNRFVRAREARSTEIVEDYVELIGDLIAQRGEAHAADVARTLGVTQATVSNVVTRLARDGLVTSEPYRSIRLTARGKRLADASRKRHAVVRDFLLALGVGRQTAEVDAEGIEHHASKKTLAALRRLTRELAVDNGPRGSRRR